MGKFVTPSAGAGVPSRLRKARTENDFGRRVKMLRRARGFTLQQLSEESGLVISTLSKIENGQMSPTYERLLQLAQGLKVDVSQLFSGIPREVAGGVNSCRRSVTRSGQGPRVKTTQYDYQMLGAELTHKHFIPLLTVLHAHSIKDFPALIRHEGEEFIYVLSGKVVMHSDAYEPLHLEPGDACYFDSTMGHACLSAGDDDAIILWVSSQVDLVPA